MGENGPEAQHDGLTVHIAKFMESNNRSGKQIRDFIDILIDVNMNATADTATEISMFDTGYQQTQEGLYDEAVTVYDQQRDGKGRIPEKSDFSQYRQYQPGELATGMDGGRTEGNSGPAVPDGRIPQTVPADAPGGQRSVTEQRTDIKGTGAEDTSTVGMVNQPSGDIEKSRTVTNTGLRSADADIRQSYRDGLNQDETFGDYEVKHNKDTLATAQERTSTPERVQAEYDYLSSKDPKMWGPEDKPGRHWNRRKSGNRISYGFRQWSFLPRDQCAPSSWCRQYHIFLEEDQRQPAAFKASLLGFVSPDIQSQQPHSSTMIPGIRISAAMILMNSSGASVVWCFLSAAVLCCFFRTSKRS